MSSANNSVKKIIYLFFICIFLSFTFFFSAINSKSTVYADEEYSQEEIDAAKAWLSAHGYPPTRAGAEQAYQDYLDGKLDNDPDVRAYKGLDDTTEETTEETTEATTQTTTQATTQTTTELTTEATSEMTTENIKQSDSSTETSENPSQNNGKNTADKTGEEKGTDEADYNQSGQASGVQSEDKTGLDVIVNDAYEEPLDRLDLSDVLLITSLLFAILSVTMYIRSVKIKKDPQDKKEFRSKKAFIIWLIIYILVMILIFIFSAQVADDSQRQSDLVLKFLQFFGIGEDILDSGVPFLAGLSIRKLAHITIYAILGLSAYMTIWFSGRYKAVLTGFVAALASYFYATLDEYHQNFVEGRAGLLKDTFIDSIGFGTVIILLIIVFLLSEIKNSKKISDTASDEEEEDA